MGEAGQLTLITTVLHDLDFVMQRSGAIFGRVELALPGYYKNLGVSQILAMNKASSSFSLSVEYDDMRNRLTFLFNRARATFRFPPPTRPSLAKST